MTAPRGVIDMDQQGLRQLAVMPVIDLPHHFHIHRALETQRAPQHGRGLFFRLDVPRRRAPGLFPFHPVDR